MLLYRGCHKGVVKVFHKADAHNARTANSDIGVAREIAIDLYAEKERGYYNAEGGCLGGIIKDSADVDRDHIRNADLFEKSDDHML